MTGHPRHSRRRLGDPAGQLVPLRVVTRVIYPTILVIAVYLFLVGLKSTGGGFAAGLLIGLGLALRYLATGTAGLGRAAPVSPGLLLGSGLVLAAAYGIAGLLLSGDLLAVGVAALDLGPLGRLTLAGPVVFELAIILIVVGLVLDVLRTLGASDEDLAAARAEGGTGGEEETSG